MANPTGMYHRVNCSHLKDLSIQISDAGKRHKERFATLGISSRETVRNGLLAVDASPFKTIFVVRETTGQILFALSKNEAYVASAKKKRPKPVPPTPPLPTGGACCAKCRYEDGTQAPCIPLDAESCLCSNQEGGGSGGLDDELETLGF